MTRAGFSHRLHTAIESLWEDLEQDDETSDEPEDLMIDVLACMMHTYEEITQGDNHCDPDPVLPLESYKKLAHFRWASVRPDGTAACGRDFFRIHGHAYHELMRSEWVRLKWPGPVCYDDQNANIVAAIREYCPIEHRQLQNVVIGYVMTYPMLFTYIPMICKRAPSWIVDDRRYGFFEFMPGWHVQFRMYPRAYIEYVANKLIGGIPINSFDGTLVRAQCPEAEVLNEYVRAIFDKCLLHLTRAF